MCLCRQTLQVVDESRSAVFGILVVAPDVNCLFRANFLAIAAEDASELVDLEHKGIAVSLLILARYEFDAVRRAHGRTKPACDAFRLSRFSGQHAMRSTPTRRDRSFLFRILGGDL